MKRAHGSQISVNDAKTHQCDELFFVQKMYVQEERLLTNREKRTRYNAKVPVRDDVTAILIEVHRVINYRRGRM